MPSLSDQKLIRKLRQRKYRWQERLFVAEGPKLVQDILNSGLEAQAIWSTEEFADAEEISERDLQKLSHLSTANKVLAIFPFPEFHATRENRLLILDGINDPGNLGTLLRTADWFGFQKVICTAGTTDVYNAKAVQSTMGSLSRLSIEYLEIEEIQSSYPQHLFLIADMDGADFRQVSVSKEASLALVMGSESHGPSDVWGNHAKKLTIPKPSTSEIDSLNVGIAAAILMQHFAI